MKLKSLLFLALLITITSCGKKDIDTTTEIVATTETPKQTSENKTPNDSLTPSKPDTPQIPSPTQEVSDILFKQVLRYTTKANDSTSTFDLLFLKSKPVTFDNNMDDNVNVKITNDGTSKKIEYFDKVSNILAFVQTPISSNESIFSDYSNTKNYKYVVIDDLTHPNIGNNKFNVTCTLTHTYLNLTSKSVQQFSIQEGIAQNALLFSQKPIKVMFKVEEHSPLVIIQIQDGFGVNIVTGTGNYNDSYLVLDAGLPLLQQVKANVKCEFVRI